jgi:excisionase family DNA binding protein
MTKALVSHALKVPISEVLTAKEAAVALGIKHRSVLKAAGRGRLKGTKFGEGRGTWYFTRTEVERYRRTR